MYNYYSAIPDINEDEQDNIVAVAERNIHKWYNYFAINYQNGEMDKQFALLSQWSLQEQADITRLGLPLLQFNKIYDYTKKIIGEAREITPNLQVRSKQFISEKDANGLIQLQRDVDLVTNMVRGLSYNSESNIYFETAFANTIYCGYGALHLHYDYENNHSFHKTIRIGAPSMPERAFFDPTAVHPCKIDGDFCGVYHEVDKNTFAKLYPGVEMPISFPCDVPRYFSWFTQDTITVVDYYCKKYFKKKLVQLDTGEALEESEVKEYFELLKKMNYALPKILEERECIDFKIMHYKMVKNAMLEKNEFPSKTIMPVIFMDGDSFIWQGRQYTQSFIHQAMDAQRFLNYAGVAAAQSLKNIRREQYLATPDQIRGFEDTWNRPELVQGYLPYNADPKTVPPIKLPPSEISQSLYQYYERAEQDIQSILGIYNQNLAQPVQMNQMAVNAKMQQGTFSAQIYRSNYIRAVEQVGRCVLEMIPRIFDTERTIGTLKHDGTSDTVKINYRDEDGNLKNDVTKDIFELSVEAGTSFAFQKQNELELLTKLTSSIPQVMPLVADLIADNLELPNRPQLVERLRTLVPPQILAKEQGKPMPPQAPQPNPMAQMAQKALQQKDQEMQLEQQKLQSKGVDQQLKAKDQQLEETNQQISNAKLAVEHEKNMSNERQKHLETLANTYRSGVDLKGNALDVLSKLIDITNTPTK
jgi:hypothetical protein